MSIFDIIRYPISDIYNDQELGALPDKIWDAWLAVCCNEYSLKLNDMPLHRPRSTIVSCIELNAVTNTLGTRQRRDRRGGHSLIKVQMTKRLKEVIAAYDQAIKRSDCSI